MHLFYQIQWDQLVRRKYKNSQHLSMVIFTKNNWWSSVPHHAQSACTVQKMSLAANLARTPFHTCARQPHDILSDAWMHSCLTDCISLVAACAWYQLHRRTPIAPSCPNAFHDSTPHSSDWQVILLLVNSESWLIMHRGVLPTKFLGASHTSYYDKNKFQALCFKIERDLEVVKGADGVIVQQEGKCLM